jgi:hypothetical protein
MAAVLAKSPSGSDIAFGEPVEPARRVLAALTDEAQDERQTSYSLKLPDNFQHVGSQHTVFFALGRSLQRWDRTRA